MGLVLQMGIFLYGFIMELLLIVPSVAGAIASYLYFCKVKYEKLCAAVIAIVSGW